MCMTLCMKVLNRYICLGDFKEDRLKFAMMFDLEVDINLVTN